VVLPEPDQPAKPKTFIETSPHGVN